MFSFKKKYFLIIESIKDIDLEHIKKRNKFIIIYRKIGKFEEVAELLKYRKRCKSKNIKFFVANDLVLAVRLGSDGVYLSAKNRSFKTLNLNRKNFNIIGSAHNIKEINLKKKQGCKYILLSRLFRVTYKPNLSYLGVNKLNTYIINIDKNIFPLGGINFSNLNKLKNIMSEGLAIMSEVKKKPAIISRLF